LPTLHYEKIIDLTHPIATSMPVWPGDPKVEIFTNADLNTDGFNLNVFAIGEHTGTHIGVAAHFQTDETTIDKLAVTTLFLPCVVANLTQFCEDNPDFEFSLSHLSSWESIHGIVPAGSIFLAHTGWSKYWGEDKYFGKAPDNSLHFPGFDPEVVKFLIVARKVSGLGIDTAGIDPGKDAFFASNKVLLHGQRFHLENLNNLSQLATVGSHLFIGALNITGGTGSPARIIALSP